MTGAAKISLNHPFMNRDVILNFTNEMANTLQLMASIETTFEKPYVSANWNSPKEISVFLDIMDGAYKGRIQFHFDKLVAKQIIENMVGSAIDENSAEILDGVGEISNIFYGSSKTKLNEIGFNLNVSTPHPCWTKDLPEIVGRGLCMVIPFKINNRECFVEFLFFN